jgi:hypothetical protein
VLSLFFIPGRTINRTAAAAIRTTPTINTTKAADVDIFPDSFLDMTRYLF